MTFIDVQIAVHNTRNFLIEIGSEHFNCFNLKNLNILTFQFFSPLAQFNKNIVHGKTLLFFKLTLNLFFEINNLSVKCL